MTKLQDAWHAGRRAARRGASALLDAARGACRPLADTGPARWPGRVLGVLLALDLLMVLIHVLHKTSGRLSQQAFAIDTEWGPAETLQYAKEAAIAVSLGALAGRTRSPALLAWSLLFGYLLLDDALGIHEVLGLVLAQRLRLPGLLGLPPHALGEILAVGAVTLVFLAALAATSRFARRRDRDTSRCLLLMLGALALSGVGADAAHTVGAELRAPRVVNGLLGILEDGGEHVVMSVILWFALVSTARRPPAG